jgi:hypothetical protein
MTDWVVALTCGGCTLAGLGVGYFLGYQHGKLTGELRTLKSTMAYLRGRRNSRTEPGLEAEKEREPEPAL